MATESIRAVTSEYGTHGQNNKQARRPIAAIYARVSSVAQLGGYSLEEQIRLCRERCVQMGWEVRYIFRENESGASVDRPKFLTMLERAKHHDFDTLVFWRLDRFCRSLVDLVNIERELARYGISLHSIVENLDTTSSVGRFNFRNLASVAEMERDLLKERVQMGLHGLALQKRWPNRRPPLGYDVGEDGRLVVNQNEARLVRELFRRYLKMRSMPQMAFELAQQGVPNKGRGRWTACGVKKILNNRIYIGEYAVAGVKANLKELEIVDVRTFNCVQKVLKRNRPSGPMPIDRRKATIDRVFAQYFETLREEELMDPELESLSGLGRSKETIACGGR